MGSLLFLDLLVCPSNYALVMFNITTSPRGGHLLENIAPKTNTLISRIPQVLITIIWPWDKIVVRTLRYSLIQHALFIQQVASTHKKTHKQSKYPIPTQFHQFHKLHTYELFPIQNRILSCKSNKSIWKVTPIGA